MDANQTRLQLLLGCADWARCQTPTGAPILPQPGANSAGFLFAWDSVRSELTLAPRINVFQGSPANRVPTGNQRRGAAADRFGNVYWIADSQTEILVRSSGTLTIDHFWASNDEVHGHSGSPGGFAAVMPASPPAPIAFRGLAVTEEHYLVVGSVQPAGLLIFDLFRGGPPRQVLWPSDILFSLYRIAPAVGGGIWILDLDNDRMWQLDRTFALVPGTNDPVEISSGAGSPFVPVGSGVQACPARQGFPSGTALDSGSPLRGIQPVAMTVLPDNSMLLMENDPSADFSSIYRLREGVPVGNPVSLSIGTALLEPADQPGFRLLGFDFAFIANEQTPSGSRQNTLYVVGQNGDQAWAFTADFSSDQLSLTPLPEYYPMRLFGGRGLVVGASQVFYDSQSNWVPLVIQKRPRYVEDAVLLTVVMDGKQPDCVWDRLMLDAVIPGETQVIVSSRAGNDPQSLLGQGWFQEPAPYARSTGSEIPWSPEAAGESTWELLFQNAVGQYLQLQVDLHGNRQLTPRLRALRAYYPRFSYLQHYLPGVYRENPQSASFLDRLLCNFSGFYTTIEDRLATVEALFDAGSAPRETLDWLANWFGVALDPAWSDAKRRLFLKNATTFFEARGTVPGLMMALRLAVEDCADQGIFTQTVSLWGIRFIEEYQKRRLPAGMRRSATAAPAIPSVAQSSFWTPDLGPDELNQRYAQQAGAPQYPVYLPPSDPGYSLWSTFSMTNLGVVPEQPAATSSLWPTFLSGRYRTIGSLNNVYGTSYGDFTEVAFPSQLPRILPALWDWYQFQGILMIDATAHQFTIYLPIRPADAVNTTAQRATLGLVQRVVELEKPAHTSYEIKFYWAFFRLGDARLGQDSVLNSGSRVTQLMLPALIGDTYLGSAYLSPQMKPRPFLNQRCC